MNLIAESAIGHKLKCEYERNDDVNIFPLFNLQKLCETIYFKDLLNVFRWFVSIYCFKTIYGPSVRVIASKRDFLRTRAIFLMMPFILRVFICFQNGRNRFVFVMFFFCLKYSLPFYKMDPTKRMKHHKNFIGKIDATNLLRSFKMSKIECKGVCVCLYKTVERERTQHIAINKIEKCFFLRRYSKDICV